MALRAITEDNWRDVVRIEPREEQKRFVASVAYYLNLCNYGGVRRPLALYRDGRLVGFPMWGFDADEKSYWIGGLIIGAGQQGKGYGREAMEALLDFLATQPGYRQAALSCEPDNAVARGLHASLGFVETGARVDGELVARRQAGSSTATLGG